MRRVTIFGSTGSIGCNTVDLLERARGDFRVVALTGGRNVAVLAEQAVSLGAELAVTADPACHGALTALLAGTGIEAAAGPAALIEAADRPADWFMSAIVGAAGLVPGFRALRHGTTLALANKESLVCAGPLLMAEARAQGARILPVDSEHSAVFQALVGEDIGAVERVIITASGGAFRDWPIERLASATPAEASCHPNWAMGQRITIDSASMFNKALELIETREYFGVDPSQIEAVIHPESLIHALVGFRDGALMAHVGPPDMRHAINALNWPGVTLPVERLDLTRIGALTFRAPCDARYPALRLARAVMAARGLSGAMFNGAKERALDHFIAGRIGFCDMAGMVESVLDRLSGDAGMQADATLDNVLAADHMARTEADRMLAGRSGLILPRADKRRRCRRAGILRRIDATLDLFGLIPPFGNFAFTILAFVVALSIIVAIHEYGHYIVGRWCGIHAEVFSLGFGPRIYSRRDRHGTLWQVAALPLGGYVKFLGDADAASGPDGTVLRRMDKAALRRTMHAAPLWARAATVAAGPLFNFALSILVFSAVILVQGQTRSPLTVRSAPDAGR